MNYKKAHKIINYKKDISLLANDWSFRKTDKNIIITSAKANFIKKITYKTFVTKYIGNENITLKGNNFIGEYLYSSLGLITKEEFNIAENLMVLDYKYRFSELENQAIYLSSTGKEYLMVKDIKINVVSLTEEKINKKILYKSYLIEIKDSKLINVIKYRNSINLIDKIGYYTDVEKIKKTIINNRQFKIKREFNIDNNKFIYIYFDQNNFLLKRHVTAYINAEMIDDDYYMNVGTTKISNVKTLSGLFLITESFLGRYIDLDKINKFIFEEKTLEEKTSSFLKEKVWIEGDICPF